MTVTGSSEDCSPIDSAAATEPSPPDGAARPRGGGRLFAKYVALFVAVVTVALLFNGVIDAIFYFREHRDALVRIQREQAGEAAGRISQFTKEIESQLGWTTQLPWSASSAE